MSLNNAFLAFLKAEGSSRAEDDEDTSDSEDENEDPGTVPIALKLHR